MSEACDQASSPEGTEPLLIGKLLAEGATQDDLRRIRTAKRIQAADTGLRAAEEILARDPHDAQALRLKEISEDLKRRAESGEE